MRALSKKQSAVEDVINYYNLYQFPKGINKDTFIFLLKVMVSIPEGLEYSVKELGQSIRISQPTLRRYLNFLVHEDILQFNLHIFKVGHPIKKYSLNLASDRFNQKSTVKVI